MLFDRHDQARHIDNHHSAVLCYVRICNNRQVCADHILLPFFYAVDVLSTSPGTRFLVCDGVRCFHSYDSDR